VKRGISCAAIVQYIYRDARLRILGLRVNSAQRPKVAVGVDDASLPLLHLLSPPSKFAQPARSLPRSVPPLRPTRKPKYRQRLIGTHDDHSRSSQRAGSPSVPIPHSLPRLQHGRLLRLPTADHARHPSPPVEVLDEPPHLCHECRVGVAFLVSRSLVHCALVGCGVEGHCCYRRGGFRCSGDGPGWCCFANFFCRVDLRLRVLCQ